MTTPFCTKWPGRAEDDGCVGLTCRPPCVIPFTRSLVSRQSSPMGVLRCMWTLMANSAYFAGLCRRRGWNDPTYDCIRDSNGFTCLVLVNGRAYKTDLMYESGNLAQENAAMRAFMVCRSFSVNNGMLARNGIVQGLPADETTHKHRKASRGHQPAHHPGHAHSYSHRSGNHSSSSSTASLE